MKVNAKKNYLYIFICVLFFGVALRFFVMSFGFNFDFESYCIVGDIVVRMRNVYSETGRYNYAPIFSLIQGILYWISSFSPNRIDTYRVLIVILLTGVDLGITYFILQKYGVFKACFFF